MRHAIAVAAFAATLALGVATAVRADDSRTLSAFLASCQNTRQHCLDDLTYGFEAANEDMAEICPPPGLSESDAVEKELGWMRSAAAADATLAAGPELDAEWTALHTLWPCKD